MDLPLSRDGGRGFLAARWVFLEYLLLASFQASIRLRFWVQRTRQLIAAIDRQGRVLGLATAKYLNSEGFGIFHGTPLLCYKIVLCTGTSQIWLSAADKAIADKAIADKAIADKAIADIAVAAVDAANEATDAANAATDAANAAAEQADAATAAAIDAADAVASLAIAFAVLMADLNAQVAAQKAVIASLSKLVTQIQSKLKT